MSKIEIPSQPAIRFRRRLPPNGLQIQAPAFRSSITLLDEKLSAVDSSSPDLIKSSSSSSPSRSRATRNMKRLSLALPSAIPDVIPIQHPASPFTESIAPRQRRRPSIISLPNPNTSSLLHRKGEDESPSAPYADGPVEILPGIWLGSVDNARDWNGLIERGIKSILNVAKEVSSPFDTAASGQPLKQKFEDFESTYYPAHGPSGRPAMHYLKLPWSHGQTDLVQYGFVTAMDFVDEALSHGGGVLIHCQCGISRSATISIALVMRAAAQKHTPENPEVWTLGCKGMQGAYNFVKDKSRWVSPNMSLIYQLMEYERFLNGKYDTPSSSEISSSMSEEGEEEEWGRRRQMLDEFSNEVDGTQDSFDLREARALDMAMEDRITARREAISSLTSYGSESGSNWHSRYRGRRRTESVTSDLMSSVISEDLAETNEELELSTNEDSTSVSSLSSEIGDGRLYPRGDMSKVDITEKLHQPFTPMTARPRLLNEDSSYLLSTMHVPLSSRPSLNESRTNDVSPLIRINKAGSKRRPPSLALSALSSSFSSRYNTATPPRGKAQIPSRNKQIMDNSIATPTSQTLFVFPPSPTLMARTPSAVTITSKFLAACSTPKLNTPKVSTFNIHGRRRSFIDINIPDTPTTASSRVDACGWIGKR